MISYRFAPRVIKVSVGLVQLLLFAACTEKPTATTRTKKPAEISLPFTKPPNFQEIEKALARFDWGPAHDAPCQGCLTDGEVTIRYVGQTKDIKADAGPANRRIVALVENWSDQDVAHAPSKVTFKAHTKYLMWVHKDGKSGKAIWGFIELGDNYQSNPKPVGLLLDCHHTTVSPTDDAAFYDCNGEYSSGGWIKSAHAATSMMATIMPTAWVACDPDCCTGSAIPPRL